MHAQSRRSLAATTTQTTSHTDATRDKSSLRTMSYDQQVSALTPPGRSAGTAGGTQGVTGGARPASGQTRPPAKTPTSGGSPKTVTSGGGTSHAEEPGLLGTIADGLRAADAWLQGGGDKDSGLHGSRLTTEFPGAGTQGPAIKGHADRDINVDLIMAIANAKGMPGFNGLPKYSALTGKDLIVAMFKDPEFGADMLTKLVGLFDELSALIATLDPDLSKKLEAHARTIDRGLEVAASGFSRVDQSDGPEAKAKHPNDHYVKGLGWVPTVELVVEYGKTTQGGRVFEYVRWADHVTQYATDGALRSGPPPEAKGDPYFFVGGKTVRGFVSAESGEMVYEDLAMPRPSWAKR